jgi:hypothetical protein
MGDLYASPLGTMVLRHQSVPQRTPGLVLPDGQPYNDVPYDQRGWYAHRGSNRTTRKSVLS